MFLQRDEFGPNKGLEWYDYGARMYDPQIGRWGCVDLLASDAPSWTPYRAFYDNPIMWIDPTGMGESPILNEETGELMGTDDQGLKGEGITMKKGDFMQNMTHNDALIKGNLLTDGKMSGEALDNAQRVYNDLPLREDYDGTMSYFELIDWGKQHPGLPVFIDIANLDLGELNVTNFLNGVGKPQMINLVFVPGVPIDVFAAWGKNEMTLQSIDKKTGSGIITMHNDGFDYKDHSRTKAYQEGIGTGIYEDVVRNPCNTILRTVHGVDQNFKFPLRVFGYHTIPAKKLPSIFFK
jgi:RHS repeat-associated protein